MSREAFTKRIDRLYAVIGDRQNATNDAKALELINAGLMSKLALISEDGTLPEDFDEQCALIDEDKTPEEQAIIDRWARKYNAAGAKEELLRELEAQIRNEEAA